MTTKEFTYDDLQVNVDDVYELMGYGDAEPDEGVKAEVEELLGEISQWLRPRFSFFVTRGELLLESNELKIGKTVFGCGGIVARQLKGAEAYAFFVCTAGMEFQKFMDRLMAENDMVRVYTAHSIGSVLAERCADLMEKALQAQIDKLAWKRTNRYSPGYCGWHVREQQRLFPLFNGQTSGVHLTESSLMMPIKSVSGVIGLGPEVRYHAYTCGLCNFEKCYKRKARQRL